MRKADELFRVAQALANKRAKFTSVKGPGVGDKHTNSFMEELRDRAAKAFGSDHSEQKICGPNGFRVDFYFPDEQTIVEVALGLRNPLSEYERDIIKALMARRGGHRVSRLVFVSKPGARKRLEQPGAKAIATWAKQKHRLEIVVWELGGVAAERPSR